MLQSAKSGKLLTRDEKNNLVEAFKVVAQHRYSREADGWLGSAVDKIIPTLASVVLDQSTSDYRRACHEAAANVKEAAVLEYKYGEKVRSLYLYEAAAKLYDVAGEPENAKEARDQNNDTKKKIREGLTGRKD